MTLSFRGTELTEEVPGDETTRVSFVGGSFYLRLIMNRQRTAPSRGANRSWRLRIVGRRARLDQHLAQVRRQRLGGDVVRPGVWMLVSR